jgi:hypothetical protein
MSDHPWRRAGSTVRQAMSSIGEGHRAEAERAVTSGHSTVVYTYGLFHVAPMHRNCFFFGRSVALVVGICQQS